MSITQLILVLMFNNIQEYRHHLCDLYEVQIQISSLTAYWKNLSFCHYLSLQDFSFFRLQLMAATPKPVSLGEPGCV